MKKITKLLSVFIIAGAVGAGVAGVAGCKKDKGHSHSIDPTKWTDNQDASTHDGFCSCGELMVDDEEHVYDGGTCIKCGAAEGAEAVTVTGVTVSAQSGATAVAVDGTLQLSANVAGTGNPPQTVTWSSSDDGKATVSDNGLVTGVGEGQVTITATSTKDTSKSNTITLTVVAKGTLITIPDYAALVAQSDKLYNNDFSTAAARLPDFSGTYGGTRGVYTAFAVNSNTAGATNDTHYVKVDGGKAVQVNPGAGTAYTVVDFGAIKGDVEGYIDVTLSEAANSMTFVQFIGNSSAKTNSEVFGLRTDGGAVKYRLDGGSSYVGADPAISTVTEMAVYFRYASGKFTVAINGNFLCKDLETTITKLSGFRLASGDSNTRTVNADNIVFCGEEMSAADYAIIAKANLDTEYAKYILTGNEATHNTNGGLVTKAYNDGVSAITAATTLAGISEAYDTAVAAMKDVLADAEIAAAKTAAEAALDEKFPSDNYTYAFAAGSADAIYNNQATYATEIAAIKGQIASGATTKSNLDAIVAGATISIGNNAVQLAAKKAAATGNDGDIAVYKATETAAIETTYPTQYANIGDIKAQAVTDVNAATSIDAVNEIIAEAKADIDSELQATTETPAQTIARYQGLLEADGTTAKTGVTDADKIAAVDAAVTAGKAAIANATQASAGTVYDAEKAKVQTAIPKYEAKATLLTDKNDAVAEIHGDSTAATTATTAVNTAYNDGVEAIEGATSTTAVDAALDTAQKAIAGAITTLKATKFTITVKKADGTTISNGLEIAYGKTLAIDDSKLTITDTEKLDKFYSKCEGNVLSEELTLSSVTVYDDITVYASITEAKKIVRDDSFKYSAIVKANIPLKDNKTDNAPIPQSLFNGTQNEFMTILGTGVTYRDSQGDCIELKGEAMQVTIVNGGTLTIQVASTGGQNWSSIAVKNADGEYMPATYTASSKIKADGNVYAVNTTTKATFTYNLPEGTYTLCTLATAAGEATDRSTRLFALTIHEEYKVDLDVSVVWGSGTAQKYYHDDVITLPEEPEGNGKFAGWYNKTTGDKFEGGKLAAGSYVFEAKFEYNVKITYNNGTENVDLYLNVANGADVEELLPKLPAKVVEGTTSVHNGWTCEGVAVDFENLVVGSVDQPKEYTFVAKYDESSAVLVANITVTAADNATSVEVGKTLELSYTATAAEGATPDNTSVIWSSSDTNIATVEVVGGKIVVTGVSATAENQKVTITATAADESGVIGTIELTVEAVSGTTYEFKSGNKNPSASEGATITLNANCTKQNGYIKVVKNTGIITLTVNDVAVGSKVEIAVTNGNNSSNSCKITASENLTENEDGTYTVNAAGNITFTIETNGSDYYFGSATITVK